MANECIPLHEVGPLTCVTTAAVTGKRFVDVSSGLNVSNGTLTGVAHAAAAGRPLGVAVRDAASGARVAVELRGIVPVTCSAAIAAGAEVEVAAGGKAVTKTTGTAVGRALSTTTAADTDVFVKLY